MFVLVVGGEKCYYRPFAKFGDFTPDAAVLWNNPQDVELVVLTGGADISPSLYGQSLGRLTFPTPQRDIYECVSFHRAKSLGIPMVGVCRGHQLLNAMAGGGMIQHTRGHEFGHHEMTNVDGRRFEVTSSHHQMVVPAENSLLLAWSSNRLSDIYLDGENRPMEPPEVEPEAIYLPGLRAIGFQYHPEGMLDRDEGFAYADEAVEKYLM